MRSPKRKERTSSTNNQDTFAYFHHDHLDTPIQATDKQGRVVWAATYDAFGKATITTPEATPDKPTITVNLRLPGQIEDIEAGLHYNWNRYYDPDTGRYITQDPVGLEGGINFYGYAFNDPMNFYDPLGLRGCGQSWFDNVVENYLDTHRAIDSIIDNLAGPIPDFITGPGTPFTLAFGGGAAKSIGEKTLWQAVRRYFKDVKPRWSPSAGGYLQGIKTPGLFTRAIGTTVFQGIAIGGAWSFGVLVGSMITATVDSFSCDCER